MVRELPSDHAGETGAVFIYKGITAVACWRQDAELLAFARLHGDTEAEHLRLMEDWLPAARRSRLLVSWRMAGWLTGALPALFGRRDVYGTIATVETFVDVHDQQQIDHLRKHFGPEGLLPLHLHCQVDEQHHRDEAAALAGPHTPWFLRLWYIVVGSRSAAAVRSGALVLNQAHDIGGQVKSLPVSATP
jgi:ubiquinone biosynthesis monooxygenase Coq7